MLRIFVVSDATGETAERMVRSALVQFETSETGILRRGQIRARAQVRAVVEEAAAHRAIILHTFISDGLRDLMPAETRPMGELLPESLVRDFLRAYLPTSFCKCSGYLAP
jgi:[pyruvate, water dikinase]-phosphate phosphotransferase / [pyruvate, water dikinase] kinase